MSVNRMERIDGADAQTNKGKTKSFDYARTEYDSAILSHDEEDDDNEDAEEREQDDNIDHFNAMADLHNYSQHNSRSSSRRSSIFSFDTSPLDPPNEHDINKFTSDDLHFSMIRNLHLADYITMMNGFCGFYSIVSCLRFALTDNKKYISRANLFIFLGMFFDFFDGRVARLRNRSSLMGQELDSLADLVSFGCGPALVAFSIGMQTTMDVLCLTFFVLCGLTRLARFNVTVSQLPKDSKGKSQYFEGFPIPTSLFWVLVMEVLTQKNRILLDLPLGIVFKSTFFEFHLFTLAFFLHGCAMISKSLKIPKP